MLKLLKEDPPLVIVGVLSVAGKITGGNFEEDELLIISNLASQTAVAVENDRLHMDAEKTYLETVSALAMAVEARDPYSRGHSDRVSQYSVKIAQKLGLDEETVKNNEKAPFDRGEHCKAGAFSHQVVRDNTLPS